MSVALVIQHAMRMRYYCHLWIVRLYNIFPSYLINCTIFYIKKVTAHKVRVLIFLTKMSETFHIPRRTQRDAIINAHRSSRKVPVILVKI